MDITIHQMVASSRLQIEGKESYMQIYKHYSEVKEICERRNIKNALYELGAFRFQCSMEELQIIVNDLFYSAE